MAPSLPAELELKLRLPRGAVEALLAHPALRMAKRGRARTASMHATYFDTADLRLAQAGIGLRLRREGRAWRQTIKGPLDSRSGGGLAARPEYEWPLAARGDALPPLDRALLGTTPWADRVAKAARAGLAPAFTTRFRRTSVPLAFPDSSLATLAVDVGTIRGAGRSAPLCEVEIELESGHAHNLFELALALAADIPLALEPASKAARGCALVMPGFAPRVPARATPLVLARRATTAEALGEILRDCLRQIGVNAEGLVADDDPEWVHQMRIGTRRLRAALALMRKLAPGAHLDAIGSEARWLAQALGRARDLDVLADLTLPALARAIRRDPVPGADGDDATLAGLRRKAGAQRDRARAEARRAVASPRFVRWMLAVGAFAARENFGVAAGTPAAATLATPAQRYAGPVLARRHRKLLRRGARLPDAPAAERHAARLAAKRLRYAAEFFAALFPRRRAKAYTDALRVLQDELGALNDAVVAASLAAELAGPGTLATATLRGYAAAQTVLRRAALDDAWHHFIAARPFWARD